MACARVDARGVARQTLRSLLTLRTHSGGPLLGETPGGYRMTSSWKWPFSGRRPLADHSTTRKMAAVSRATLSFVTDNEPDQLGRLQLAVETSRFSGVGEDWGWPDLLKEFATALSQFPISDEQPPALSLGYDGPEGRIATVSIVIKPADARGTLSACVDVSHHLNADSRLRTTFSTHYPDVERFQRQLRGLAAGDRTDAVLEGS